MEYSKLNCSVAWSNGNRPRFNAEESALGFIAAFYFAQDNYADADHDGSQNPNNSEQI